MRSTFALLAIALVFACRTKAGGVQIVATNAPASVRFLRVYLGTSNVSSTLDSSTTLTVPAPVAAAMQGSATVLTTTPNIFVRDAGNGNDTATYDGHDVAFEFESDGVMSTISAAIVVGYTSSGSDGVPVAAALLQGLPVKPHEIDVYTADLGSAGVAMPFLWSSVADSKTTPVTSAECAGFSGGAGSAFIVAAANDEDCDGYVDGSDLECSEFVFNDQAGVSTNETCFYNVEPTTGHAEQCRLGGRTCLDGSGVGSDSQCEITNTCMPNIACACTSTDINVSTNALGCVGEQQTAAQAGYGCTVGAQMINNCTIELPPVTTGGMPCKTTGNHGGLAVAGTTKFSTNPVDAGGYSFTLTINAACGASLEIEPDSMGSGGGGGSGSSGSGGGSATGQSVFPNLLVKLELVNGASLIYPVVLTADPTAECAGDESTVCTRAAEDPFDDVLQQCVAGWGERASTGLTGTSPTLDAGMTVMYYIDGATKNIMQAMQATSGAWSPSLSLTLTLMTPPAVAVHITDDGQTLFVTDSSGDVNVFQKQGMTFIPVAASLPFMPGATQATWYSPNNAQQTDIIYADSESLWELMSSNGPPFPPAANAFEKGQTPYLGEDSSALWFAGTPNGSAGENELFAQQRLGSAAPFSTAAGIPELGTSVTPQGPWVEPLPLAAPNQQMMFFSSEAVGAMEPTIYSVQRAPLLLP
jgi:hypothetical protein